MALRIKEDLTGKKFNHLTILEELGNGRVLCRCDCGNVINAKKYNVMNGYKKSCGCIPRSANAGSFKIKDLTGKKYNHLTIIKELGGDKVLCHCDCGNDKVITKSKILNGQVKSCGCQQFDWREDLTGQKFNMLTVIKKVSTSPVKWLCKCDCGNTIEVDTARLKGNKIKSCGCLKTVKYAQEGIKKFNYIGTNIKAISPGRKINKNNKSGVMGVFYYKRTQKWTAYITLKRERVLLGYFDNKEEAIKARKEAEKKYFLPIIKKYFANKKTRVHKSYIGQKFGKLTILEELGKNKVLCRCDCGSIKEYVKSLVVYGNTKSCGCTRMENILKAKKTTK